MEVSGAGDGDSKLCGGTLLSVGGSQHLVVCLRQQDVRRVWLASKLK